jgi:hypothetical protein
MYQMQMDGEEGCEADLRVNSIQRIKSTFKQGFEALYSALATALGISDTKRLIGVGLRQMAIMLSREGQVWVRVCILASGSRGWVVDGQAGVRAVKSACSRWSLGCGGVISCVLAWL